jgi:phage gp29-like protein
MANFIEAIGSLFRRRPAAPVALPTLGAGGPRRGLATRPNTRRVQTHPLVGADVDTIHTCLLSAFRGHPARLMDLFDDMRDRDTRVDAVCRTRTYAVQGRPWSVRPPDGWERDAEAKQIARDTQTIIRRIRSSEGMGWRTVVGEAVDGVLRGFAPFEIEWDYSPEGWRVPQRMHWRHPNRFAWDETHRLRLWDGFDSERGSMSGPLDEVFPDKFLVYSPTSGRAGYPMRRGVMIAMLFPSLTKRYGVRWWMKAAERWGMPLPYVKLTDGDDEQADEALALLNRMMADWAGVFYGDQSIEVVPGSGNLNPLIYSDLVAMANVEIAIQGLGQNLTTEVGGGGSFAATKAHDAVRRDYLAADLGEFDDWITSQLIPLIVKYNWPGAPEPIYVSEVEQRERPELAEVQAGVFSKNDLRTAKGYSAIDDEIDVEITVVEEEPEPEPPAAPAPPAEE